MDEAKLAVITRAQSVLSFGADVADDAYEYGEDAVTDMQSLLGISSMPDDKHKAFYHVRAYESQREMNGVTISTWEAEPTATPERKTVQVHPEGEQVLNERGEEVTGKHELRFVWTEER